MVFCRCVWLILMILMNFCCFVLRVLCRCVRVGRRLFLICLVVVMCIVVGKMLLEDWL